MGGHATTHDLPNAILLPGDCFGWLTSLIYNCGDGVFRLPGGRSLEMRAIAAHVGAKRFELVSAEFLSAVADGWEPLAPPRP